MVRVAHCCFIVVIIVFHVIIFYVWLDVMTRGGGWFWLLLSSLSPISILSFLAYGYRFYFVSADHDELRYWVQCCINKIEPELTIEDARRLIELWIATRQSAKTQMPIELPKSI